jgi:hypothetical protein
MPRHTARNGGLSTYTVSEHDSDGVGRDLYFIGVPGSGFEVGSARSAERAARLLVLALNLEGGLDAATTLLRAELTRQS